MSKCTWAGCDSEATQQRRATDGEVWADLCDDHAAEMESSEPSIDKPFSPAKLLGNWIKAQGGSQSAAKRMTRRRSTQ